MQGEKRKKVLRSGRCAGQLKKKPRGRPLKKEKGGAKGGGGKEKDFINKTTKKKHALVN